MPWIETEPMNEKIKFISAYLNNTEKTFSELCNRFNISCKTGYKYVNRYNKEGVDGLKEKSKAPHSQANHLPYQIEKYILKIKSRYPTWGSKKILKWLEQEKKNIQHPARSTIDAVLKRNNLVRPRKNKRRVATYNSPFVLCESPNDVWSIDYKGQFILGNKELCYPLTITDNFSRYILAIKGSKHISGNETRKVLEGLFREFGLPKAIRSDNGSPFAGTGIGGLSRLAVWFIKLGIVPERIRAGHPEENGRHERMHFTLKQETACPPQYNQKKQQNCFDAFRKIFNEERPHEGIEFNRPAWIYSSSNRAYSKKNKAVEYDTHLLTRAIRSNGTMKWKNKEIFISETLLGERIALKQCSEEEWIIYYSFLPLGIFNEKLLKTRKI